MTPDRPEYEAPSVVDLGSLAKITGGGGMGNRDDPSSDGMGKT